MCLLAGSMVGDKGERKRFYLMCRSDPKLGRGLWEQPPRPWRLLLGGPCRAFLKLLVFHLGFTDGTIHVGALQSLTIMPVCQARCRH